MPQNIELFSGTIRENVTLGKESFTRRILMKNKKLRMILAFLMLSAITIIPNLLFKDFNQVYVMMVQVVLVYLVLAIIVPSENK